ncbi:MAG: hypothetical protein ACI39R_06525 [Lachnospiraceae bacterium]
MNEQTKKKLWPVWIVLGALPGVVVWLFLIRIGIAGEFAGLLAGFGAIAFYRWSGAELKTSRLLAGSAILIIIALLVNQIGYSLDVYIKFAENWYGAAGEKFSFWDAFVTVFNSFLVKNSEGMRKFYIEAGVQGILCTLLMWIALFIYYRKMDELDEGDKSFEQDKPDER